MRQTFERIAVILAVWIGLFAGTILAQTPQPTPVPNSFVHDFANVIPDDREKDIQAKALEMRDAFKVEVAVVIVQTLNGESPFDYSLRMARTWGIGSPDNSVRGLLIVVAIKERKTSFRTSRHLEGDLPDSITGSISRNNMNPRFAEGKFGEGLSDGMSTLLLRMRYIKERDTTAASTTATPLIASASDTQGFSGWWLFMFILPIIFVIVYIILRKRATVDRTRMGEIAAKHETELLRREDETRKSVSSVRINDKEYRVQMSGTFTPPSGNKDVVAEKIRSQEAAHKAELLRENARQEENRRTTVERIRRENAAAKRGKAVPTVVPAKSVTKPAEKRKSSSDDDSSSRRSRDDDSSSSFSSSSSSSSSSRSSDSGGSSYSGGSDFGGGGSDSSW